MNIEYKKTKVLLPQSCRDCFCLSNGNPEIIRKNLYVLCKIPLSVISAWDGNKLVGLVRALDDGETVAFALSFGRSGIPGGTYWR